MREIKFRSWNSELSKMFTGANQYGVNETDCRISTNCVGAFTRLWESIARLQHDNDIKLMQFIGIKDFNGVDIYDGDILLVKYDGEKTIHTVEWGGVDYPAFELNPVIDYEMNSFSFMAHSPDHEFIVIGNIHENEDLL